MTEKPVAKGGAGRTLAPKALTNTILLSLKKGKEPFRIRDTKTAGLSVRVSTAGVVTFYVTARVKGSGEVFSRPIGRFSDDLTLQQARDRAEEITKAARAGRYLIEEEKQARREVEDALTIEALIERYLRSRVRGKLRTAEEIDRRLRRGLKPLLGMKAETVRRKHIRELLDEVAESGREREAEKRRQTIGAMFRWAVAKDLLEIDPVAGLPAYDPGTPRDRILPADEIRALVRWLDSDSVPPAHATVLRLQLLLGARVGEIAGMKVEEINRETWVWTLPAARSKNGRPRATPIIGWAREILAPLLDDANTGALFLTEQNSVLSSSTVGAWLRSNRNRGRIGIGHFTTHDLRRTFASNLDEMGISRDLIGALIGHESGERGTAVLRRHYLKSESLERKAAVLASWETRLREICEGGSRSGGVVPFRKSGGLANG